MDVEGARGREVAWALWDYVKDLDPGTDAAVEQKGGWFADQDEQVGVKRRFDSSWGYDDEHVAKKARMDEDAEEQMEEESQVVQHTLGVMLRRLGIDPKTLGWNEQYE